MELKDLLGFVDIVDVKTIDEFKEKFNGKFAPKTELDELSRKLSESTGKMTGAATTLFKRLGELDSKDVEGKKWEEVAELAITKFKNQAKELEGKQGQGANDEAIKDLQKKIEKLSKERDDYKTSHEALQGTYEKEKTELEGKLKGVKIGHIREAAKGKLSGKLKADMSAAEKIGFEAVINDLIVDLDDNELPIVKDKEGKRVQNPNKAGAFLSLEEAMEMKASELNLIKKNTGNGGQNVTTFFAGQNNQQQNNNAGDQQPMRRIHPNALAHADKMKG